VPAIRVGAGLGFTAQRIKRTGVPFFTQALPEI
jgi:hypothetical protein